jgi:hypothetical protein
LLVAGVLALSLAGCASPITAADRGSSPPASAAPTPGPLDTTSPVDPNLPQIVIGSEAISVYAGDGSDAQKIEYTEPTAVFISSLNGLFGAEPVVSTYLRQGDCDPSYTMMSWDGFAIITHEGFYVEENPRVSVIAHTASIAGYAVTSSLGLSVGDDVTHVFALQPDEFKYAGEWEGEAHSYFYFDVIDPPEPVLGSYQDEDMMWPWAAYLSATGGIVDTIAAPDVPGMAEGC